MSENTKDNNPLVSIIVITYNSARYVVETLESARVQTYQNIELIVSDDCSTDNTVEICREWIEENKERFVQTELITVEKNTGIPANCNRGVRAAQGEWVKLIAGDDALTAFSIKTYVDEVLRHPEKLVLFSNVTHYQDHLNESCKLPFFNTSKLQICATQITPKEQFEILLRGNKIWAGSLFIAKNVFNQIGLFDETLRYWEDRPMLLKITSNNIKIHFLDFISCKYRKNSNSVQISKNNNYFFTKLFIEQNQYYVKNYIKFLPIYERVLRLILYYRSLLIINVFNNNKNLFSKVVFVLLSQPWQYLISKINTKYV